MVLPAVSCAEQEGVRYSAREAGNYIQAAEAQRRVIEAKKQSEEDKLKVCPVCTGRAICVIVWEGVRNLHL